MPNRLLDGIDLAGVLEGKVKERPSPLFFWQFHVASLRRSKLEPWIDPELQEGTTPLVKLMNGKATRDFTNYRHPAIAEEDYLGPRAIIDGRFKLVIHENKNNQTDLELFDLRADPAENSNRIGQQPKIAKQLQTRLREWQQSVLHSLTGVDYSK